MSPRSVFCIATSRGRADRILNDLRQATIASSEISVLLLDQAEGKDHPPAGGSPPRAGIGLEPTGIVRGVLGTLGRVGVLTIPGAGRFIAAGPLMTALSSNPRRSLAAGIAAHLIGFGIPTLEAGHYESRIKDGEILISVRTENPDKCDQARAIFAALDGQEIFTIVNVTTPRLSLRGIDGSSRALSA